MKYMYLGKTGMKVSRLCLGTMNFGPNTNEAEAFRIMDCAVEAGINFFDTANMYGGRNGGTRGWTEEIIGRWFAQGGGRREKVILATKVFEDMNDPNDGPNGAGGLSAYKIRRHVRASMNRLQTDHVELLYMHNPDPHASWNELWSAFETLTAQGQIDYVGCSNFAAYQMAIAQAEADKRNFLGLVCNQTKYNLLARLPELELIPTCRALNLGFLAWSPLQGGMLSGSLLRGLKENQRSGKYADSLAPDAEQRLRRYAALCQDFGLTESEVSTAWLLSRPGLTAPLVGPRTVSQLEDIIKTEELVLPEQLLEEVEKLFPGPGMEAPMAYAKA